MPARCDKETIDVAIAATVPLGGVAVIASATIGWFHIPAFLAALIAVLLPLADARVSVTVTG